jgi:predicted nucleotidyltransferase
VNPFARLLGALAAGDVQFVVIGGVAATVHGSARLTRDVDVCYARDDGNLTRLVDALSPLRPYLRGAPAGLPFDWSVGTIRRGLNFTLVTTAGDIDLFGEVPGVGGYPEAVAGSIEIDLFGQRLRCLDLPTLLRAKRAAGRPRDLEVIAELEIIAEENDV